MLPFDSIDTALVRSVTRPVSIRTPAVAGSFYPQDPESLRRMLGHCLAGAPDAARNAAAQAPALGFGRRPKALIAPHAGYVYSGPIAGSAYGALAGPVQTAQGIEGLGVAGPRIERVILIGPSHFVPFAGLAVPRAAAFETPLGIVPIDEEARRKVLDSGQVIAADRPHASEHSLEVQLPFLQLLLGEFRVLPIAAGDATAQEVAAALDCVWGDEETLIIVSSDLSHYLTYSAARRIDAATAKLILDQSTVLGAEEACGHVGINGLMLIARRRALRVELLDLRNSGDTAPDRSRVVGYGAFALHEA